MYMLLSYTPILLRDNEKLILNACHDNHCIYPISLAQRLETETFLMLTNTYLLLFAGQIDCL